MQNYFTNKIYCRFLGSPSHSFHQPMPEVADRAAPTKAEIKSETAEWVADVSRVPFLISKGTKNSEVGTSTASFLKPSPPLTFRSFFLRIFGRRPKNLEDVIHLFHEQRRLAKKLTFIFCDIDPLTRFYEESMDCQRRWSLRKYNDKFERIVDC